MWRSREIPSRSQIDKIRGYIGLPNGFGLGRFRKSEEQDQHPGQMRQIYPLKYPLQPEST